MTDERQALSVLMDGELDESQATGLCVQVGRDSELRATWERYHLAGRALRGELIDLSARSVADSVRSALASEPVPIAPRRAARSSRTAPFAGAALATAAALLAVFAVPAFLQGPSVDRLLPAANLHSRGAMMAPVQERRWNLDRPDLESKLDLFLVNHQEAAPATGVKGMLPYATLIGYESGR